MALSGICWPCPISLVIWMASTRLLLCSIRYPTASAPPRISTTASAASAGLRSRGEPGSLRVDGDVGCAQSPCGSPLGASPRCTVVPRSLGIGSASPCYSTYSAAHLDNAVLVAAERMYPSKCTIEPYLTKLVTHST